MKTMLTLIAGVMIASLSATHAHAGAWMQPAGGGQIITTATHYYVNSSFTADSERTRKNSGYQKSSVDVYAEYGLTPAITFGMQPTYLWVQTRGAAGEFGENGLSDTPLFLRERLWHDAHNVVSVQQLVTIPGPYRVANPAALGYHQADAELRGLYGHSGDMAQMPYFIDLQGAYRKRFEAPADELRFDATLGITPIKGLTLLAQSFTIKGLRNPEPGAGFFTASGPDYDLSKVQLSGLVALPQDFSLQLGVAHDVAGRNTGGGNAVLIGIWRSF